MCVSWFVSVCNWLSLSETSILKSPLIEVVYFNLRVVSPFKRTYITQCSVSVQFSCSVMSDSLQPRESQHARPPCPSQTPGVYSNTCSSSQC